MAQNKDKIQDLEKNKPKLFLLPGSIFETSARWHYEEAYRVWYQVWAQTLAELDGVKELSSDQFTRQDLILSIFDGPRCAALACFRRADLSCLADRSDSWFTPWPSAVLDKLAKRPSAGLVISYYTVHPDYRRAAPTRSNGALPVNASQLLAEAVSLVCLDSGAEVSYGVTRNNRSMNKTAGIGGSVTLLAGTIHHGVSVDLIALYPDKIHEAKRQFSFFGQRLWEQRSIHKEISFQPKMPKNLDHQGGRRAAGF